MLENDDSLSIAVSEASYRDGEDKDGEPTYARGVTAIVYRNVAKHKAELLKSIGAQATKTISARLNKPWWASRSDTATRTSRTTFER